MTVKIENNNDNTFNVYSPYSKETPTRARQLGGKWSASSKCWTFASSELDDVKAMLKDIYGTDGTSSSITIHLRAKQDVCSDDTTLYVGVTNIGRGWGRDSNVQLSDDVIVTDGEITMGGSRRNPRIGAEVGTEIKIKNYPAGAVDKIDSDDWEIIEDKPNVDTKSLLAEKEALLKRLSEIDALLSK